MVRSLYIIYQFIELVIVFLFQIVCKILLHNNAFYYEKKNWFNNRLMIIVQLHTMTTTDYSDSCVYWIIK